MIVSFRHKDLKLLHEKGDRRRVLSQHADKIGRILARLDEATEPMNMNLPGFR
jgi:toxin HigB-1